MSTQGAPPIPPIHGDQGNLGTALLCVQIVFIFLALAFVSLRLYTRTRLIHDLGSDDLFIVLAMILAFVVMAFVIVSVHYGIGKHTLYVSLEDQLEGLKYSHALQPPWVFSLLFTRISVCCFLLRLFSTNKKRRYALYGFIGFMTIVSISIVLTPTLGYCRPRLKYWYPTRRGECVGAKVRDGINYYTTGFMILCDFVLATLPIIFLWSVQIAKKVKLYVCIVMALGFFTMICAVVRVVVYKRTVLESDENYHGAMESIWVALEMTVAIIAACTPTLGPLIKIYPQNAVRHPKSFHTSSKYNTHRRRLSFTKSSSKASHPLDGLYRSDLETGNGTTATGNASSYGSQQSVREFPGQDSDAITKTTDIHLTTFTKDETQHDYEHHRSKASANSQPYSSTL